MFEIKRRIRDVGQEANRANAKPLERPEGVAFLRDHRVEPEHLRRRVLPIGEKMNTVKIGRGFRSVAQYKEMHADATPP